MADLRIYPGMDALALSVRLIAWLIALAWICKLIEAWRGLATVPNLLDSQYDVAPEGNPAITVIVPARNEEDDVPECLHSLLRQDYRDLRIIAVDDRSTDRTGEIMDRLAVQRGERLQVIHVAELPTSWLGKTHAMALAAKMAIQEHGPEFLLFTDGDIVFREDAVRRSLAHAVSSRADHFVLLPTTEVKTMGEGMLLSFLQVMSMWAIRVWRVADPRAKRDALGVGAFNLIRTTTYQEIGGFEAAAMEILEDLDLGKRVKDAGYRQRVATGPGMVCVHWAAGALGIVTGMTKNLFAVFRFRLELLLGAAASIAVFCVAPASFLFVPGLRAAGVAAGIGVAGLYGLSSRSSRISPWFALSLPVAAAMVIYSMFRSMAVTVVRGGVAWRGSFYPLKELRGHVKQKK